MDKMMKSKMWWEIVLQLPPEAKDAVFHQLFELGAEGISEEEDKAKAFHRVRAFFPPDKWHVAKPSFDEFLGKIPEYFSTDKTASYQASEVEDYPWAEEYKKFYKAQKLSRTFFLKPQWDEVTQVPPGMIPIIMNPGQAFGTGIHPSTRLAIQLMERSLPFFLSRKATRFLDVGTGTGIIAIAAEKLGFESIDAIDNDPFAVEAASENVVHNHCMHVKVSDKPIQKFVGQYQLIVSNILLETHKELFVDYQRLLPIGGQLILSGLLAAQKREIDALFLKKGFIKECQTYLQEWMAVTYTRVS